MYKNFLNTTQSIVKHSPGPLFIAIAATLWALDGILRRSLFTLPPLSIVFFEHVVGSILLLPFFIRAVPKLTFTKQTILGFAAVSILSGVLGTLFFTTALLKSNFIPFSVVFLLQKLQPLFATTTAALFLKEKITKPYVLWAGLALVAAYFVTFPNGKVVLSFGDGTTSAALFALGAAACWGIGTTLSKYLLSSYTPITATSMRFFLTSIFSFLGLLWINQSPELTALTPKQFTTFIFIALSTGMIALYLYYVGLKKTQAKVATIIELIFPFLAVLIDAVVYKTLLTPLQLFASVVLVISIFSTARINAKK